MSFIEYIKSFWKKEEELDYPSDFAIIKTTDVAKESFIDDKHNKIIVRYINGAAQEPIEFTEEEVKALREIEEIPIIEEDLGTDFDFEQETNFGEVVTKR